MTAAPALTELNTRQTMQRMRASPQPHIAAAHPQQYPQPAPEPMPAANEWAYDNERVLWLEVPESIAPDARIGVVSTACGAIFILRVLDPEDPRAYREIQGYPSDILDLAWALNNAVGLIHGLTGDAAHDASVIAEHRAARVG